jgi:CRISPR system Cascade subunit CasD
VAAPRWPLFLGRKGFPPGQPLRHGILDAGVEEALATHHLVDPSPRRRSQRIHQLERGEPVRLRTVVEVDPAAATAYRHDQPLSFDSRRFAPRPVRTGLIDLKAVMVDPPVQTI